MHSKKVHESPPSLQAVLNFSGLTKEFTNASLPSVPSLVPQLNQLCKEEEFSSFLGQEFQQSDLAANTTPSMRSNPPPPLNAPQSPHPSTLRANQRPRYVLPPGVQTISLNQNVSINPPQVPSTVHNLAAQSTTFLPNSLTNESPFSSQLPLFLPVDLEETFTSCQTQQSSTTASSMSMSLYQTVSAYWFYSTTVNGISVWWPFSKHDSYHLETEMFRSRLPSPVSEDLLASSHAQEIVVPVDGGRYDVFISQRLRRSVYWEEPALEVRRATWFYQPQEESRVLPFSERICDLLEVQYKTCVEQGQWGQRFELPSEDCRGGNDVFIFHSPQNMVQYLAWPYELSPSNHNPNVAGRSAPHLEPDLKQFTSEHPFGVSALNARICNVRRGLDDQLLSQLDEGEVHPIDQLFFIVHGIGSIYNLKGQGLIECANDMRRVAKTIHKTHFPYHTGRSEFLPILWHDELHSDATGIDGQLSRINLRSIPKLRQFTNDTLMDILFYTSPKYAQLIINTVGKEICRLRNLFLTRNPDFKGQISILGHSLGAVIAFDLLANQNLTGHWRSNSNSHSIATTTNGVYGDVDYVDELINPELQKDATSISTKLEGIDNVSNSQDSSNEPCTAVTNDPEGWSLVNCQSQQGLHNDEELANRGVSKHSEKASTKLTFDFDTHEDSNADNTNEFPVEINYLSDLLSHVGLDSGQIRTVIYSWLKKLDSSRSFISPKSKSIRMKPESLHPDTVSVNSTSFWLDQNQTNNPHQITSFHSGFGMPVLEYPQLGCTIAGLYTLGSPLPLFLTSRGVRTLSIDFHLPTCSSFFNIFHPFDPVAYRMETLIEPEFRPRAVLIPHHKGRKRIHLQLKDNLAWVGSELKSKLLNSVQSTWRSLHDFALAHKYGSGKNTSTFESAHGDDTGGNLDQLQQLFSQIHTGQTNHDREEMDSCNSDQESLQFHSRLNQGRRIDYVLQEGPLESFNEYLFALTSHAAYWESEDTVLFILSEAYSSQSVHPIIPGQKSDGQASSMAGSIRVDPLSPPPLSINSNHPEGPQLSPHLVDSQRIHENTQPFDQFPSVNMSLDTYARSAVSSMDRILPPNVSTSRPKSTNMYSLKSPVTSSIQITNPEVRHYSLKIEPQSAVVDHTSQEENRTLMPQRLLTTIPSRIPAQPKGIETVHLPQSLPSQFFHRQPTDLSTVYSSIPVTLAYNSLQSNHSERQHPSSINTIPAYTNFQPPVGNSLTFMRP